MAVFVERHKLNYIPRPCPAKEVYKAQANHYEKRMLEFTECRTVKKGNGGRMVFQEILAS